MENEFTGSQSIKYWAEDDRPREKMLKLGKKNLSDAELLAILLGSGSKNESALDLSRKILRSVDGNLDLLGKNSVEQFVKSFKGVGQAKAITIIAALELGIRRAKFIPEKRIQVTSSQMAYDYIYPKFSDLQHEEFWVIYLNRANYIKAAERISAGGITGTVVDIKLLMKRCIELTVNGIILVHNHPSGNTKPSDSDINLTKKIKNAAQYLDIALLDHLIVTDTTYLSFNDNGLL